MMVSEPAAAPDVVGSNCTPSVADCPGVNVAGNVDPESVKPVPVTVAEFTVTDAEPVDVKVTVCVDIVFNATSPNPTLVALMLSDGAAVAIVSIRVALPVPTLLVALSVTADVAAAVGVPEIKPVPLFTVNPAGNPVAP